MAVFVESAQGVQMARQDMRITEVERDIWRFLWARFEEGRGAPSVVEMAKACYCSHQKVLQTITKLEAKGFVTWQWIGERRAARGCLTVVAPDDELARIDKEREALLKLDAEARAAVEREKAKLRMRRVRARRKGALVDFV